MAMQTMQASEATPIELGDEMVGQRPLDPKWQVAGKLELLGKDTLPRAQQTVREREFAMAEALLSWLQEYSPPAAIIDALAAMHRAQEPFMQARLGEVRRLAERANSLAELELTLDVAKKG